MRRERSSPRPDLTGELSFRLRLPLPIVIPLGALLVIALLAIGFSRVLLSLQPEAATAVALVMAANVLIACGVIAARPNMARSTMIEIILIAFYPLLVGFVLAQTGYAAKTEAGAETHVSEAAASEAGGEQGAPSEPAPSGGGAAPADDATLAASGSTFDTQELSLAPGATVTLDNQDSFPHNFAVYKSEQDAQGGQAIFTSPDVEGGASADFAVKAPPGEYYFQCDFHPTTMNGTLTIGGTEGAAGTAQKQKPAGKPAGGAAAAPSGPVQLTASQAQFDTDEITVSAGAPAKVDFDNQDDFPHNFAVYESEQAASSGGKALFTGPNIDGGQSQSFSFKPPPPGDYFFRCDFHPTTMTGTLTVQ